MLLAVVIAGECEGCSTLAKVLFWAGAVPTLALGLFRVGDNIAMLRDEEHLNGGWCVAHGTSPRGWGKP